MSTEEEPVTGSASEKLRGWFSGRMPGDWFAGTPDIRLDREEISVIGTLPAPESAADATDAERAAAVEGRSRRFREETRQQRIDIAREAEHRFGRKVSWGVICAEKKVMFTTFSVPVMTRLRQPERLVLDTLVDPGVPPSPSDALAWWVRLVGEHQDNWLPAPRQGPPHVCQGPSAGPPPRRRRSPSA